MTAPEFSHAVKLDQIGSKAQPVTLDANQAERAALCSRFDLLSLEALTADLQVSKKGDTVAVTGQMTANYAQACPASGVPIPVSMTETLDLRFVPTLTAADAEVELTGEDCDIIEYEGQTVDLGEAVAQSLGLSLNPYPRSAQADAVLKAAGVKAETEVGNSPFAGLAGLRDKLGGN
jgi:uncharacterized metal-binding protein YceD (DUF177 family)